MTHTSTKGESLDPQAMLSAISNYVLSERRRRGINSVDTSTKPELSCEAFGEFTVLLERQLMTTAVGYGDWASLDDIDVLEGVYRVVERRSIGQNA